jgi:hypothetical protein
MWYTIFITLVVDFGGLLLVYILLRDRVRRATTSDSQIEEIREEVSRLLVELNQATDRNIALMEDKITSLNDVLSAADKKIGLLHREIEKHDVGSQIYSRLAEGRAHRLPEPDVPPPPPAGEQAQERIAPPRRETPREKPLVVELSERPGGRETRRPDGPTREEIEEAPAAPDLRERVMMLHRSGFSPSLIASRVGVPLGEVELIISLEQRKGKA